MTLGHQLSQKGLLAEAEACFHKAIELNPDHAMAHNNLGWVRQRQSDNERAVACYGRALQLNPGLKLARRNLAALLVRLGRREESFHLWHEEARTGDEGIAWIKNTVSDSLNSGDLQLAGQYAAILAELRWASPWYPRNFNRTALPLPVHAPEVFLTISKLRHDIEQFQFLQRRGILGDDFAQIINNYQGRIDHLQSDRLHGRVPLDSEDLTSFGHVFNRIVHLRDTPSVPHVFSARWDPENAERQYLEGAFGLVVVDDFLSTEALESVRAFCLESTVWSTNRYAHGRLGAFFHDGFNCPLLLQIAAELRLAFPRVIGQHRPLRQLWGFKNGESLPADSTTHADFAVVNVNFWITPDDANVDNNSGGLVVYNVGAPPSWDFKTYNTRKDLIDAFLREKKACAVNIPYRQNRAIIFDSDLFHATAGLRFRSGYENRRINITMLYGDREKDPSHLSGSQRGRNATSHSVSG